MKRCGFILFVLLSAYANAQITDIISIGLRTHVGGVAELNNVIGFYNENRTWLDNPLGKHNFQNGIEVGFEKSEDEFGLSALKYYRVWNTSTAKGTTPAGEEITRKVKSRVGALEIVDFWYTPFHLKSVNIGFGIMPMALGRLRIKTKLNDGEWEKQKLSDLDNTDKETIWSSSHIYSNIHLDATANDRFHLQLFYSRNWQKGEYDVYYVNSTLNPSSVGAYKDRTQLDPNNFGIKLTMTL